MKRSPIAMSAVSTVIDQPPGAPALSAFQVDDHNGAYQLTPSTVDAAGNPQASLTGADVVVAKIDPAAAQALVDANNWDAIVGLADAQLEHHDAIPGERIDGGFDITEPGETYCVFATVTE